jgi:hypothetical protein
MFPIFQKNTSDLFLEVYTGTSYSEGSCSCGMLSLEAAIAGLLDNCCAARNVNDEIEEAEAAAWAASMGLHIAD